MTLQFEAPFQINPYEQNAKQKSLAQLGQTFSDLGNTAMQYSQQNKENKIRQAMLALSQQQGAREQGVYNYEYGDPSAQPSNGSGSTGDNPSTPPMQTGPVQRGPMGPQGYEDPTAMQSIPGPAPTPSMMPGQAPQPQPMHQPGTDLTGHFNNWKQSGMPTQYNHPDLGGTPASNDYMGQLSRIMNMPGAKRQADAANIFKSVGEGAKNFSEAQPGVNTWSPAQYSALQSGDPGALTKAFPNGIPRQAGEAGLQAGRFGQSMGFRQQEINAKDQETAQGKAQKLYEDYVTKNNGIDTGVAALAQAASNPATFNTSLIQIGQALGMTGTSGRNPRMIIDAIAKGNPSLLGQLQQASEKGLSGQLTQQLQQGLAQQLGALKESNRQAFEQKAQSHVQQTTKYFNGDQNQAKSALFPTYQWGGQGGGKPQTVQRKGRDGQTYTYTLNPLTGQYE